MIFYNNYSNFMKLAPKLIPILILTSIWTEAATINYSGIKTYSKNKNIQMVVEIPAGTNKKIEYSYDKNKFVIDLIDQKDRIIDFLPYPGNYGFIPSTLMSKKYRGDGDALDILLISETLETGAILDIIPIGMLVLEDSKENDTKIIAIPVKKSMRIIDATSYTELCKNYPAVKDIIQLWFLNYKGDGIIEFIKWDDEVSAKKEVDKWLLLNEIL